MIKPCFKVKLTPQQFYKDRLIPNYPEDFTWEQLYLKLDLEFSILTLQLDPDFVRLYQKLSLVSDKICSLTLYVINTDEIKSGYYYLCVVLSKLTQLKVLTLK